MEGNLNSDLHLIASRIRLLRLWRSAGCISEGGYAPVFTGLVCRLFLVNTESHVHRLILRRVAVTGSLLLQLFSPTAISKSLESDVMLSG